MVGRVVLSPVSYLDLIYRFRLDKSNADQPTQEVGVSMGPQSLRIGLNYLLIPAEQPSDVVTDLTTGQSVLYGKRQQLIDQRDGQADAILVAGRQRDAST